MRTIATRLAAEMESALRAAGDPARAVHEKRYLRSDLEHAGASVPAIRRIAHGVRREHPSLARADLLDLVTDLWVRPLHECRMAAVELLDAYQERLQARDLRLLERLLREARTWALVDGLAANVAGAVVERYPALGRRLDRWARDEDFWIRRASLLADLVPLRQGRGDFDRFFRHADALLDDREFFVAKAIGWVLRDASRRRPVPVARWLRPRAARAAGVTIREAVKYLAPGDRAAILAAARPPGRSRAGRARQRPAPPRTAPGRRRKTP